MRFVKYLFIYVLMRFFKYVFIHVLMRFFKCSFIIGRNQHGHRKEGEGRLKWGNINMATIRTVKFEGSLPP